MNRKELLELAELCVRNAVALLKGVNERLASSEAESVKTARAYFECAASLRALGERGDGGQGND